MPALIYIPLIAVFCLLLLWLLLGFLLFRFAFVRQSPRKKRRSVLPPGTLGPYREQIHSGIAWADSYPAEQVFITAPDGLRLAGRVFGHADAKTTLVAFHGYRSYASHDFGSVLPYYVEECGLRVLLVDQRAHERSEGKYITFGIKERYDCLAWAKYAADRFGGSVILDGISMGSATVLMASNLPLPQEVVGVIADCGYSSPDAILRKVARDMRVPAGLFLPLVYFLCRRLAGFDPRGESAPAALAESRLPVLFIHGTGDDFVPYTMSEECYAACRDRAELCLVEGAGHGLSYLVAPEQTKAALSRFFDRFIAAPTQ